MSFRRPSDDTQANRRWKAFVEAQFAVLCDIGFPEPLFRVRSAFDHWLMHGNHPGDPSRFAFEDLGPRQREQLIQLLRAHAEAGFADPGIGILTAQERETIWHAIGAPGEPGDLE